MRLEEGYAAYSSPIPSDQGPPLSGVFSSYEEMVRYVSLPSGGFRNDAIYGEFLCDDDARAFLRREVSRRTFWGVRDGPSAGVFVGDAPPAGCIIMSDSLDEDDVYVYDCRDFFSSVEAAAYVKGGIEAFHVLRACARVNVVAAVPTAPVSVLSSVSIVSPNAKLRRSIRRRGGGRGGCR